MFFNAVRSLLTAFIGLAFLSLVPASPLSSRDVVVPKIITPNANTVWTVGHVETVTWDTSNFPPDSQITNPTGRIFLGYEENDSLNLDLDHPLASRFKLRDGSVQITVPDVRPRNDYIVVLLGNSGNTSPAFTITKITGPSTSESSSRSFSTNVAPSQTVLQPYSSSSLRSTSSSAAVHSTDPQSLTPSSATAASSVPPSSTNGTSVPASTSQAWPVSKNVKRLMALTTYMTVAVLLLV